MSIATKRRIFIKRTHPAVTAGKMALAFGAIWFLFGCAAPTAEWSGVNPPKAINVTWQEQRHIVRFGPDRRTLDSGEAAALYRFVESRWRAAGAGRGPAAFRIAAPSDTPLTRIDAVTEIIRRAGARIESISAASIPPVAPDHVAVLAGRYTAAVPACPDWSQPAGGDPANQPHGNFGCATQTNLALMLADPGDLKEPATPGPASGARLGLGARRHDLGALKPLPSATPGDDPQ